MDRIALQTLRDELNADCKEAEAALRAARERVAVPGPAGYEATAFQLVRLFNIVEQAGLRVAKAFENRIDDDNGWHAELIRRLTLEIKGVRPPLWPASLGPALRELRGFRHVITHAYDLRLDPDRLKLVMRDAETVVAALPAAFDNFLDNVAKQEGLDD